jgi:hypothetical protein
MGEPRPRLVLAAALLLAAGCTTDGSRDKSREDPLLGSGARPASPPVANVPSYPASSPVGPPPPAYQPQPPLTATTPTSNAALAAGFQPLQGGNDLRIGSGAPTLGTPTSNPQVQPTGTAAPPAGFSPVTPVPPPGAPANNPQPTVAVVGPGGSLEQAYTAVAAQNPLGYEMKFNSQAGEYTFHLMVASRLNTAAVRHVEASAATPTEAIRRALEQLTAN